MPSYMERKYQDLGLITWDFACSLHEAFVLILIFLEQYWRDGYNLLISSSPHGEAEIRVYDIPFIGIAEVVSNIFGTEGYNKAISITLDESRKSYLLIMELPMHRIGGAYKIWNGDLIRLSAVEEKAILHKSSKNEVKP